MYINENTYEISVNQYDYGIPIHFSCEDGFENGDKIIFAFSNENLNDKEYTVNSSDFSFDFVLTKQEADGLFNSELRFDTYFDYSIKHKRGTAFLDSLKNDVGKSVFRFVIQRTVKCDVGNNGN